MAMSALERTVGRARQDHVARESTRRNDGWAFAPSAYDQDVVVAPTATELAKHVAARYVGRLSIRAELGEIEAAVEDIVNGRLYHRGEPVRFDEPMRDGNRCGFENATAWFDVVGRAVKNCRAYDSQIRQAMLDNARDVVQYLTDAKDRTGTLLGIERRAKDDRGERRDVVAVVDVGGAVRRLGLAAPSSDLVARRIENVGALLGKEIEFAETPSGFVADEVPDFARGLSEAALRRDYEAIVAGR